VRLIPPFVLALATWLWVGIDSGSRDGAVLACARFQARRSPVVAQIRGVVFAIEGPRLRLWPAWDGQGRPLGTVRVLVPRGTCPEPGATVVAEGPARCLPRPRSLSDAWDPSASLAWPAWSVSAVGRPVEPRGWRERAGAVRARWAGWLSVAARGQRGLEALFRSTWLGETGGFPPCLEAFCREGGLLPLLALSGQHVAILAGILILTWGRCVHGLGLLGWAWRGMGAAWVRLSLPFLSALALWASSGDAPSMRRALAMTAAVLVLRARRFFVSPLQIACSSAACLLVAAPGLAVSPGFVLSVAGTLGLVSLGSSGGGCRRALLLSLGMALFCWPLSAYYFGRVALFSPLSALTAGLVWSLVWIPAGLVLPAVLAAAPAVIALPAARVLERVWVAGVEAQCGLEALAGSGWIVSVRPTFPELLLVEAGLALLLGSWLRRLA